MRFSGLRNQRWQSLRLAPDWKRTQHDTSSLWSHGICFEPQFEPRREVCRRARTAELRKALGFADGLQQVLQWGQLWFLIRRAIQDSKKDRAFRLLNEVRAAVMEEARSLYPSQQLGGTIAATVAKETTDTNAPLEAGSRIDERLGTSWNILERCDCIHFKHFHSGLGDSDKFIINFMKFRNFGSFGLVRVLSFGHNRTRTHIFGDCFELGFPRLIEVMK